MKKIDELIDSVGDLDVFLEQDGGISPVVGAKFKKELLEMLTEIQFDMKSKAANDVSNIQLENTKRLADGYKQRIKHLEDFIVRLARETKDL